MKCERGGKRDSGLSPSDMVWLGVFCSCGNGSAVFGNWDRTLNPFCFYVRILLLVVDSSWCGRPPVCRLL